MKLLKTLRFTSKTFFNTNFFQFTSKVKPDMNLIKILRRDTSKYFN